MWVALLKAKINNEPRNWRAEFDALLGHCAAVTAAPGVYLAKELVEAYPEGKVILVEHDVESWARSFDVILSGAFNPGAPVFQLLDPLLAGRFVGMMKSFLVYYYRATNAKEARANLRDVHRRHNELVRSLVAKERLLLFGLAAGSRCALSLAKSFLKRRFHMSTMSLRQKGGPRLL
jgi:Sulfotransferase domain